MCGVLQAGRVLSGEEGVLESDRRVGIGYLDGEIRGTGLAAKESACWKGKD